MSPRDRALAVLVPVLALAGCTRAFDESVRVTVSVDDEAARPDHVVVSWRGGGPTPLEARMPRAGSLPTQGRTLGSVSIQARTEAGASRKLLVRGLDQAGAQVSVAAARVTLDPGGRRDVEVILVRSLPDHDGDGEPDAIDDDCLSAGCDTDAGRDAGVDAGADGPADVTPGPMTDGPGIDGTDGTDTGGDVSDSDLPAADGATDTAPAPPADGGVPAGTSAALAQGLVGYWRLDEATGMTTVADSSGKGQHGILRGADAATAWGPGRIGGALSLSGGHVRVPSSAAINGITTGVTVAAWVRWGGKTTSNAILSRQAGTTRQEHFFLQIHGGDLLLLVATGNGGDTARAGVELPRNAWVHVAGTFDGSTARVFVDGVEVGQKAVTARIEADTTPVIIGGNVNKVDELVEETFLGALDEVLLYDRPLGAAEVADLARGVVPAVPAP